MNKPDDIKKPQVSSDIDAEHHDVPSGGVKGTETKGKDLGKKVEKDIKEAGSKGGMWEWENYQPGPEVYNSLYRLRNAPPVITPNLPSECPIAIPSAESRILDRQTTDDEFHDIVYRVLVRAPPAQPDSELDENEREDEESEEDAEAWREQVKIVHVSRILKYVSPRELERFENAEFSKEAEAEEAVRKAEMEERVAKRLERNAKVPAMGRGSRMLAGLAASDGESVRRLGRPPGRGRGRRRGRGQGAFAMGMLGHGVVGISDDAVIEETQDAEVEDTLVDTLPDPEIAETSAESEPEEEEEGEEGDEDEPETTSPIMRSAFVANSALPVSPVHLYRGQPEVPDIDESDDASLSSAARQLLSERPVYLWDAEEDSSEEVIERPTKRRRTESVSSLHHPQVRRKPTISSQDAPAFERSPSEAEDTSSNASEGDIPPRPSEEADDEDAMDVVVPETQNGHINPAVDDNEAEEEQEFVIETILDHSFRDDVRYYMIKWEGYDSDHPDAKMWLPESELVHAPEMLAAYHERVRRKKRKGKTPLR